MLFHPMRKILYVNTCYYIGRRIAFSMVTDDVTTFGPPWENAVRLLALTPWVYAAWGTRNTYLPLLIHGIIKTFSGISLLIMALRLI